MWNLQVKNIGFAFDAENIEGTLLKEYQKVIVNRLIDSEFYITTGEMHELVKEELGPKENGRDAISRASVIYFMKDLHEWGYAPKQTGTGKGGIHSKYNITMTKDELMKKISSHVLEALANALINL